MTVTSGSKQATLIQSLGNNGQSTYEPLSSVWEGSDGDLLEAMLSFYSSINPESILDATYNAGRFWNGSTHKVWSMDMDPKYKPMTVGDNRVTAGVPTTKLGTTDYGPIQHPMDPFV